MKHLIFNRLIKQKTRQGCHPTERKATIALCKNNVPHPIVESKTTRRRYKLLQTFTRRKSHFAIRSQKSSFKHSFGVDSGGGQPRSAEYGRNSFRWERVVVPIGFHLFIPPLNFFCILIVSNNKFRFSICTSNTVYTAIVHRSLRNKLVVWVPHLVRILFGFSSPRWKYLSVVKSVENGAEKWHVEILHYYSRFFSMSTFFLPFFIHFIWLLGRLKAVGWEAGWILTVNTSACRLIRYLFRHAREMQTCVMWG